MSDTKTIDEKKNNNNGISIKDRASGLAKFIFTILILILMVVSYFGLSGLVLYGCKLAQSNILPSDTNCYPYTDNKPSIDSIESNIFITSSNPPLSAKINFPHDKYNFKNMIIDLFRDYKSEPNSHFLVNYFISIIESLIAFNYSCINYIFNSLNGAPEILILLFGPIITSFIGSLIVILDNFYLIYLWFAKMSWFFKTNRNANTDKEPLWESITMFSPFNYTMAVLLVILFIILFFVLLAGLPVLPFATVTWCLFSCISFKSEMNNKPSDIFTIIKDMFNFYKVHIMSFASAFIVLSAFANLGVVEGIVCIISLCLIIWGVVSINIFQSIKPEELSELVASKQATKICTKITKKHRFSIYDFLFSNKQKGGKHFTNELKKIGEKIKQNNV
jgi:hypothetical protein